MNTSAYIYCYKHTHTTCVRQCSPVWTHTNTHMHTHTQTYRYTHTNKHLLEWANIAPSCPCKILNCCNSTRNIRNRCKKSSVPYSARRRCVDCNLKSQYATKFTTSAGKIYYQHPRHAAQHTAQKWRNRNLAGLPRTKGIRIFGLSSSEVSKSEILLAHLQHAAQHMDFGIVMRDMKISDCTHRTKLSTQTD